MKKNILFLLSLLTIIISLSSCGGIDPVKYNDNLVSYSDIAGDRIMGLNDKIDGIEDLENYTDSIKALGENTIDSLKSDLNKISLMEPAKGSEDFKAATIAYMESLISYTKTLTEEYSKVSEETSDEDYNNIDKLIDESFDTSMKKLEAMQAAQKSFAKANNFILK